VEEQVALVIDPGRRMLWAPTLSGLPAPFMAAGALALPLYLDFTTGLTISWQGKQPPQPDL
jgi:hypothetical protein